MSLMDNVMYMAQLDLTPNAGVANQGGGTGESWDVKSFLENSTDYLAIVGGALLALVGLAGVIWGFVRIMMKLFGGQSSQQINWLTTIALIVVGGAFLFGGIALALNFASGAGDTVTGFGTGG